jgi:hypothetical protein
MSVNFVSGSLDVRRMMQLSPHLRSANASVPAAALTRDEQEAAAHVATDHLQGDESHAYLVHVKEPISSDRLQEIERACEGRLGPYLPHNTYTPTPSAPERARRRRPRDTPLRRTHDHAGYSCE